MPELGRSEAWPERADQSSVEGFDVYAYRDMAMITCPQDDPYEPESRDVWLSERGLRALARELNWAADRLAARSILMSQRTERVEKVVREVVNAACGYQASRPSLDAALNRLRGIFDA